ncbi:MAG: hypothetical protein IT437_00915 [Phycisphaerales bacterium]|nr:hypothetical protein [Phycisphaerales bacterium]
MRIIVTIGLAAACILGTSLCTGQPATSPGVGSPAAPGPRLRVGTFDRQSLVVAYYRSWVARDHITELRAARDAAVQAGDAAKVRDLEKQGAALQDLAHEQLSGGAPIDNILGRTRALLPGIAAAAKVDVIVAGRVVYPLDTEAVDVTEQYLVALKADDATRKVIAELRAKKK